MKTRRAKIDFKAWLGLAFIFPLALAQGGEDSYIGRRMEKKDGQVKKKAVMPVRFVPMTGERGSK